MHTRMKKVIACVIAASLIVIYLLLSKHHNSYDNELDMKTFISLKSLLFGAIKAAQVGGLEVLAVHSNSKIDIQIKGKTKEGISDPVTAADYRSHCAMYHSLKHAFPAVTVISEEISKDCDKVSIPNLTSSFNELEEYDIDDDVIVNVDDVTIWIDPLDATKEFTENLLQYVSTMVCVAIKGEPVIGVIYKPFESTKDSSLYWSWTNHGTSHNLKNAINADSSRTPIFIVSRSHAGHVSNSSKIAFGKDISIISAAGAGYKFLEVALGNATAYVHMTAIKKWDICAGAAILSSLGGKITSLFEGQTIQFDPAHSKVLSLGLLATMKDHNWYLQKFSHIQR